MLFTIFRPSCRRYGRSICISAAVDSCRTAGKIFLSLGNHWSQSGGSESKQFNPLSDPPALSLVDVMDSDYHVYGLEWTTESMKCYVDGQLYYSFTENIPSDPVDMMLLLTMEFQVNAWDPNQGDGRISGPYVSDSEEMREMSRALVDYVRVYVGE